MDPAGPPIFFLVCAALALVFGAAALALTALIVGAKMKNRSMNFPLAMLVQFLALMLCLGCAYIAVRSLVSENPVPAEAPPAP